MTEKSRQRLRLSLDISLSVIEYNLEADPDCTLIQETMAVMNTYLLTLGYPAQTLFL